MEIEKIYFDNDTFIWKTKLNLIKYKESFLHISKKIIEFNSNVTNDGFGYPYNCKISLGGPAWEKKSTSKEIIITNKLDEIVQLGINFCELIHTKENNKWNIINSAAWINRVRSLNPVQRQFFLENRDEQFHTHTEINEKANIFYPNYTYVYYIQMPNKLRELSDDGHLYLKSKNNIEYSILPKEDDLIIIPGYIPHLPISSPNSTIDRIVLAGNVGFEIVKTQKSLF